MELEDWRTIDEFPTYEVSSRGRVRNMSTGRILKQTKSPTTDLWWVGLRKNLEQHTRSIHRLVANAFLYRGPSNAIPVHIDGDKDNNRVENLEWRSLSQARELVLQNQRTQPISMRSVEHVATGTVYPNTRVAAEETRGLEKHVYIAATSNGVMRYKGSYWRFV